MSIDLEKIDELRRRVDVSYETAKDALEKFEGNMVDAIIYLEKSQKTRVWGHHGNIHSLHHGLHRGHDHIHSHHNHHEFFEMVKGLWKKGNEIRLIVNRHDKTLLNLPMALTLIITLATLHYSIAILVLALILGCRFKFEGGSENMKINETMNIVHNNIDNFKEKLTQEA